ncbi:MAG TPA: NAD-dependent epimerase/dehydratase family protein [Nitrososphaeria archaeon]|nr:NAD-dependent epimerase/dehydratase family protein [Nitrososphaeria archaeon]
MGLILVSGGAGFIGSHLVDELLRRGFRVRVVDNLSSGSPENIRHNIGNKNFEFVRGDLKSPEESLKAVKDAEIVYHLAANPEVRVSTTAPEIHFKENIITTFNLLEACRKLDTVEKLVFASSSTVYGDAKVFPTPENHELKPISVYGASKAACESLICSYAYLYGFKAVSLRYANIVGPRLRHGVVFDFLMKLKGDPNVLKVLGDGTQKKSYLYISDAIEATLLVTDKLTERFETYNIGNEDWITVAEIAEIVSKIAGLKPKIIFTGGTRDGRGWPGDVKYMLLSIEKIKKLGWKPKHTSREAIELTAKALAREVFFG